jgi:type I restriction enzyme M protein
MTPPRQSRTRKPLRPTILDDLEPIGAFKNLFCQREDLVNEAAVEAFFLSRLLSDLGYSNGQIKTKTSIDSYTVAQGSRRTKYKPDYVLVVGGLPRCVIDAKAPDESLDEWIEQCSGYCLALNRKFTDRDPVKFFVLSNGIATHVYEWNREEPILTLDFADFEWGNPKYQQLKAQIGSTHIVAQAQTPVSSTPHALLDFVRPTPERARQLFSICHKVIWQSEVGSPAFAFMEFVKVMFVKLWADRTLRESQVTKQYFASGATSIKVPSSAVLFSVPWLENREADGTTNPLDSILFTKLREDIEQSIEFRQKKRLFDKGEHINLRPDTTKEVVRRLQHIDMFGIDEDLNGRLFETFLSATMRGRELGQFFTPRSIVKMMTRLADLHVSRSRQDKVIDGCCGSGGFLIEALTVMRNRIRENASLTIAERRDLLEKVCNESLYGIDYGKDPPLARIARINMYLHGDGGSRIYYADALDKDLDNTREKDPEVVQNVQELRTSLEEPILFDVALTNPPFSMIKSRKNDTEREILNQYVLARRNSTGTKLRESLRSSVMFIERYADLLRPGGRLITVIDESILAGPEYAFVREFIKQRFLIRAIISIHGDAFRRQGSRIKTSVLLLEKKRDVAEMQPPCFTFFSTRLGVDDLTPRASDADISEARALAATETEEIVSGYQAYLAGKQTEYVISADKLSDTFDLKSCVPLSGRLATLWQGEGITVKPLSACVTPSENGVNPQLTPEQKFMLVKVGYDGRCKVESVKNGAAIKYEKMFRVTTGQLVFSTIRAVNGAVGVVPKELDGALVSQSYTVFDCGTPEDTAYLWAVLRSHEIRADIQSASTGASRYYSYWPEIGSVLIPWLSMEQRHEIGQRFIATWELERSLKAARKQANRMIEALGVESPDSVRRWEASRPPT